MVERGAVYNYLYLGSGCVVPDPVHLSLPSARISRQEFILSLKDFVCFFIPVRIVHLENTEFRRSVGSFLNQKDQN
jgi:hypothetical protein